MSTLQLFGADAEQLPIPEARIDGVLYALSIVWFPNTLAALVEWYRVLRPSSWLAFSFFGELTQQPVIGLLCRILRLYSYILSKLNEPLNAPEKCQRLLRTIWYTPFVVRFEILGFVH